MGRRMRVPRGWRQRAGELLTRHWHGRAAPQLALLFLVSIPNDWLQWTLVSGSALYLLWRMNAGGGRATAAAPAG